jgi:hypothetical protein
MRNTKTVCHVLPWFGLGLIWGLLLSVWTPALAHHGGLGIEGDLVQWALKVDQWQEEVTDQGYRIKFLAYPRQPILGDNTRLVFEIQSVASGRYMGGLTAHLQVQAPDGTQRTLPLPETTGVTAYYETAMVFEQVGEHRLTFRATVAGVPFGGTFRRVVSRNALFGDWATLVGNLAVLAAGTMTWIGLVLSIQRRFLLPQPHIHHHDP